MTSAESPTLGPPSFPNTSARPAGPETHLLGPHELLPVIYHPAPGLHSEFPRVRGYEVLSLIGSGGMGVVYKARQKDLQRIVALKTLHRGTLADADSRQRFKAEAEAVAKLQHPNIIQVFEIGTVVALPGEGCPNPFISLEFVGGGSLDQHTVAPQSPDFAARMMEKVARAAHAAHSTGVVHRDLKPANVLLASEGEPKLADFGIAKQLGCDDPAGRGLTREGMTVGTPEYMAPEQVAGLSPTPAVDIHALGVILYQLLTARVPFQGPTPADTMYLVRHQEPVSPRRLQPRLPRDLETICLKCLSKAPSRRYESAAALADDLARWLDGRPIHARPVGTIERSVRWTRRNPTIASLWAAVVLVGLLGVAGVILKWRDAEYLAAVAVREAGNAEDKARAERWERYRADIIAASSALQLPDADAARRALDAAPKEHRNWEWRYLSRQVDTSRETLRGEGARVHWMLVTPDGRSAMSVTDNHVARFWDIAGRKELGTIPDSSAMGRSWLSPKGDILAYLPAGQVYDTVVLHDIAAFKTRAVLHGHTGRIGDMCYSPDGARLATFGHGAAFIWDTATGALVRRIQAHPNNSGGGAFTPDGSKLATVGNEDRTARVWDIASGNKVLELPDYPTNTDRAAFNPSGDRLLVVSAFPVNKMYLHEYPGGRLLAQMPGHTNQVLQTVFSPDGNRIATASRDQTIRLWNGRTGELISCLRGHRHVVNGVAFSPDGKLLVSASADKTLRVWETNRGESLGVASGHEGEVFAVAFTPDGQTIVSGSRDTTVKLWDARRAAFGPGFRGHTNYIYGVACHPDGRRVASAGWDGTARVWDAATGLQLAVMSWEKPVIVSTIAFHPNGRLLASLSRDDTVRLWDVDSGREVHRWDIPTNYWLDSRLAFSPDGELLAAGDKDHNVRIWEVKSRKEVAVFAGHDVCRDVAFSPDGRLLAVGDQAKEIHIWDVAARRCVKVLQGHTECVYTLAFNRAGTFLASGSTDGTVRLWDTNSWTESAVLTAGPGIYSVAFSPSGDRLAGGCADNSIRFWDVATRQQVAELEGHKDYVHSIAFSPDGTRLVSGSGDFTVRIWDAGAPSIVK